MNLVVRNVNKALTEGFWKLKTSGLFENSRNGKVLVFHHPVMTTYQRPWERVLFNPIRDANPVFHLMESIWMLAGRTDSDWLLPFNSRMREYAESDGTIHGAYGFRWDGKWQNQLLEIVDILRTDPESRRAVLTMWGPEEDLAQNYRDVPCNTHVYFDLRGRVLNMTVCNRSNDMLWGAYGANAVHFSILQEVMCEALNVPMGVYRQFSNNLHVYVNNPTVNQFLCSPPEDYSSVYDHAVTAWRIKVKSLRQFQLDCFHFTEGTFDLIDPSNEWLLKVCKPLHDAYLDRKKGIKWVTPPEIANVDFVVAFNEWAQRRAK